MMDRKQARSRPNKRIQELEERIANQAKELRQIREVLGVRTDTEEEDLLSLIGKPVWVSDVTGDEYKGVLERVDKWTITVAPIPDKSNNSPNLVFSNIIFMKGNIVSVNLVPTQKD
jgi:hypothetical protein